MTQPTAIPKEYSVSINTDDIHEAVRSLSSALYSLIEEALVVHEQHVAEECDFEVFARDVLGVLMRHAEQLSNEDVDWQEAGEALDE
jgi:hypothetical protein